MYTTFASATLIVLGVLLSVLGLMVAGSIELVLVGLGAVTAGGILGLLERRLAT